MSILQPKPYALSAEEGRPLELMGAIIYVKSTTEQTGGMFSLLDVTCPPSFATPLHIHYAEDVAVFVLQGTLTFFWGAEKKEATTGSFLYQPRGTPHGFRTKGSTTARILYLTLPAGFDRFLFEHGLRTQEAEIEESAARYKIEILAPLPEESCNAWKKSKSAVSSQ